MNEEKKDESAENEESDLQSVVTRKQADLVAKRLADKYGRTAGQWSDIYYVAWLAILNKEPFSVWKTYIKVLASA